MSALVTLTDLKASLNITRTTDDAELQTFLNAALAAVQKLVGPLTQQSVTEEIDEHTYRIVLTYTPAVSVQSVSIQPWMGAAPIDDTAAWRLNTMTGVLRRQVASGSLPFYGRGSIFTITYTVGRSDVPDDVNRAILMLAGELWRSQRGASSTPVAGETPLPTYVGAGGFLSPDVMEMLLPYLVPPGVA